MTRARRAATVLSATVLVAAAVSIVVLALVMLTSGPDASGPARALLTADIATGPVPVVTGVLGVIAIAVVLARRWRRRAAIVAGVAAVIGGCAGGLLVAGADAGDWFGIPLDRTASVWVVATFAAAGLALGSVVDARAWRRITAATVVLVVAVAGTVGVNAHFGVQRTLADFAGISLRTPIRVPLTRATPSPSPSATLRAGGALWANWTAPKGMPAAGTTGTVQIPPTASGFRARDAGLYLPPAALVPNAPALPLVILMMGQPGNPDPSFTATALNAFAAKHAGLAPIVVVADQLGNPANDTLCLDTARFGKVETYITQDVLGWAHTHLHVLPDAAHTTVAGYSNGGSCAMYFGAEYPQLFGNVFDLSGERYAGSEHSAATLRTVFGGDRAAYEAVWPTTILARSHYPDTFGVFTVGAADRTYGPQVQELRTAATAAGWQTAFAAIPGGHVGIPFLNASFSAGFGALYPRLGLVAPGTTP